MRLREQVPVTRRALIFDTECRPMHYNEWRPESQMTAYAWKWVTIHGDEITNESDLHGGVLLQNE
jgi:hypothetical protein